MYKVYPYSSVFAELISSYVTNRTKEGFLFDNLAYWLYRFDQFSAENKVKEAILTKELFDAWGMIQPTETKTTQRNRLSALKGFSLYLNAIGIESYVPYQLPSIEKNIPYLMEEKDIQAFFEQVDNYPSLVSCKRWERFTIEYQVLFRLLYCCGLRNSEACSLKMSQVDTINGTLTILHSKGQKDRIVYLSEDMNQLCEQYKNWINTQLSIPSEWFFPGKNPNKYIPNTSVDRKFKEFWNATESSKQCDKQPTVHCLRHAFVIKRLNLWMEQGIPLSVMMPYLSNYLGHKSPIETYYYYHQIEEVFQTIRQKDKISNSVIPEVLPYE